MARLAFQILVALFATLAKGFTASGIFSSPSTVQHKSARLEFYLLPEEAVAAGGTISLTAPNSITVLTEGLTCYDVLNRIDCEVSVSGTHTFTITTSVELLADAQFQFQIANAIDNPVSTQPSASWSVLTSTGESEDLGIILTATQGLISSFQINPESQVVGASTEVQLKWRGQHVVFKESYFQIRFPIWNPNSPELGLRKTFIQGSVSCTPQTILSSNMTCVYNNDTLTITGGVTEDIPANTEISIKVTGFKNPIDSGLVTGFTVTSLVKARGVFYPIDLGVGQFQVTEYAKISQGKLEVRNPESPGAGVIQHSEDMKLSFYLPVPLDAGCRVTVELPPQYSTKTVTTISSLQAFGYYREYTTAQRTLSVASSLNSFTIRPCDAYKENDNIAVLYISQLTQYKYEKVTDSLKITILNANGERVAQVDQGIKFLPTRGLLEVGGVAETPIVQTETQITFSLLPQHKISASDAPQIVITFPAIVAVTTSPSCTVENEDPLTTPVCNAVGQTMTIKNWLAQDYEPGLPIIFKVGDVTNPLSTETVEGLQITIVAQGLYAIDDFDGNTPWKLEAGTFTFVQVDSGSDVAYRAENVYEILFQPEHQVPKNGYIKIHFPSEVLVPDPSFSQSSCLAVSGFPSTQLTCQFSDFDQTTGHYTLTILNAFRREQGQPKASFLFSIPGIQNPIKVGPTSPFIFETYTSSNYLIDSFEGGNIEIIKSAEIQNVQLFPSSYVNSMRTTFEFTMVPSVPVTPNTYILVTFPDQMGVPAVDTELSCQSTYENLISSVSCALEPTRNNTVRVVLTLTQSQINEQDKFGFSISGVRNPPSTQTTDSLQVRIVDSTTNGTINEKLGNITMTTNEPSAVQRAEIQAESYQPGTQTKYFIDFYPEHSIKSKGGILITIPPQIEIGQDATFNLSADVTGQVTEQKYLYWRVDPSARSIYLMNVTQGNQDFVPGPDKKIRITVEGLSTPFTNQPTDSFIVSSFNMVEGTQYYFIDSVGEGLSVESLCSYPCNTCPVDEPDTCMSCFPSSGSKTGLPYLQEDTCVSDCNFGRFINQKSQSCDMCNSTCLQCEGTSDRCTICGGLQFPYLHEDQCKNTCPTGFIEDIAANKCQQCVSPCQTCNNTITTCSSCDKAGSNPFFFRNECLEQCKPEISVQVGDQCVQCDHTCKTCEGTPETCTSCAQHMKFDPLNNVCTAECQPDTQIYNPELETCDTCNSNCTTCQGDINKCTECKPGFVLNKDFTCQATCNNDNQTPVNNICETCDEPCYSCIGTVDYCTTCLQAPTKYYLHKNFMCVQYCPKKYNVTADGLACEYVGLICPEGFKIDDTGDKCVPILFECAKGYELNEDLTACVPEPGSPVPFPFLIAALFVSFLVLGSYLKEKFFTKVYTCLLAIIGGFELVMYLLMVGIAANQGEWAIFALCSVGLISLIIANITFCVFYSREVVAKDQIYGKWLYFFPKTKRMIPIVCLCLNFKCSKIIYSGFYGLESSMAKFGKPMEYYRIVRLCSNFSFIFVYGFIFIADLLILAKIKWGSQLLILGIETIVLQIVVIVLTYLEGRKPPAELLSVGTTQYTSINPRKRGEVKVKSGFDDNFGESDDYEEGIPDVDETMMIRSKEEHHSLEVKLRTLAFTKIIRQVQSNCGVVDDCNLLTVMTKFDQQQIEVRRCFSACFNDNQSWEASGESDVDYLSENDFVRGRRFSWPLLNKEQFQIPVEKFTLALDNIITADEDYLLDNCIAEVKIEENQIQQKPKKLVSRRTQTYLRDLLHLDGYEQDNGSEESIIMDDEAEIDEKYAANLIKTVIDAVSGNEEEQDFQEYQSNASSEKVPACEQHYDLIDIMGEFEMDDLGNFIIIRTAGSHDLLDRRGRRINRRGYLIDRFGNVVNGEGNVIFKALELDVDDEIPAPFDHEIRYGKETFQIQNDLPPIVQEIREVEPKQDMFEIQQAETVRVEEEFVQEDESPEDDLKGLIDEITEQKIVPKQRSSNKQQRYKKIPFAVVDNRPPKRINTQTLYPIVSLDNGEQRKLAMIADNISSLTQKLALENGRKVVDSHSDLISQQQKPMTINASSVYHEERIQSRPLSSSLQLNYSKQQRPQTGNVNINQRLQSKKRANMMSAQRKEQSSLQRVYNNLEQLTNFDADQNSSTQRLDQQRKSQNDRSELLKISEIYLNKQIQPPSQKHRTMNTKPFRPLMRQYDDDPSELNADTVMEGIKYGATQGKDVSLVMAERVDQIQRNYMNQSQQIVPRHLSTTLMSNPPRPPPLIGETEDLSELRQTQQTMQDFDNKPPRQDNWIQ